MIQVRHIYIQYASSCEDISPKVTQHPETYGIDQQVDRYYTVSVIQFFNKDFRKTCHGHGKMKLWQTKFKEVLEVDMKYYDGLSKLLFLIRIYNTIL